MREGLTVAEAQELILEATPTLGAETIAASEAAGRISAEAIVSARRHPPADCSAMDGYAVRRADLSGATLSSPVTLPVVFEVPAGGQASRALAAGGSVGCRTLSSGLGVLRPADWGIDTMPGQPRK